MDRNDQYKITSEVDQSIYISAYPYNRQHRGNGDCAAKHYDNDLFVTSSEDSENWYFFGV